MGLLVISDLDGTLLDHDTYEYAEALPALDRLKRVQAPLVLCSSKTRAEMIPLWQELGLDAPLITENGGGVFAPASSPLALGAGWEEVSPEWQVRRLGLNISQVRQRFARFKDRFEARGFGDLSDQEVSHLTGLSLEQAAAARGREFNEPVVLPQPGEQEAGFRKAANDQGLTLTQGGRFFHLLAGADKGRATKLVIDLYRDQDPDLVTMGLGDSPNDLPMLSVVDDPVLVARPDGIHAKIDLAGLRLQPQPGPRGWNQAVLTKIKEVYPEDA
jgi:mannosyl-3-phosphoglycerate phosphatase